MSLHYISSCIQGKKENIYSGNRRQTKNVMIINFLMVDQAKVLRGKVQPLENLDSMNAFWGKCWKLRSVQLSVIRIFGLLST